MMKKILLFTLLINSIYLFSCEQDANVQLPDIEPKLVVTSFISPDDTVIEVNITKTLPLFEEKDSDYYFQRD